MSVDFEQCVEALVRIEATLIEAIPEVVRSLQLRDPAYCVFLLYEDGSSEDVTPTLLVGLKPLLDACNERNRQSDAWYPHQALSEPFPGTPFPQAKLDMVADDTMVTYSFEIFEPEDICDDPAMYREMLCRVARKLNQMDWNSITPVTDQFFVFVSDFSSQRLFEDLPHCVSPTQLANLRTAYDSLAHLELGQ